MSKNNFILKILCLYHALSSVTCNLVKTTTGSVRGKLNRYGKISYYSYEGIPFAQPPVGNLRFMPPVPVKPWKTVLDANAPGPVCPQSEYLYPRSEMDENCLFLNIYVPITKSSKKLPVFFVVHGGYYVTQSGRSKPIYGPQLILSGNFIVVTINYRLGALGFLSFDDVRASGNAGLKDILLASQWVKKNIVQFGGDPDLICIYGTGTGASLVHLLLLTKESSGIFRTAFMGSGSAIGYRTIQTDPKYNTLKLAQQLGINCTDDLCLNELKKTDPFRIIEAEDYIINNDPRRGFVFINFFSPSVEKPSSIALITKHPLDIIRTHGLLQKIPIITGFNNQEGLEIFFALKRDPTIITKLNENFELCIPCDIKYPAKSQERRELAEAIREFYFDGGEINIANVQNYINLITDTAYAYGIDYWIKLYMSQKVSSAVYYYVFEFDGQLNWGKRLGNIKYPGACHNDEIGYTFITNVTENKLQNLDSKTSYVLDNAVCLLSDFVLSGNPTPKKQRGAQWNRSGQNRNHMVFDYKIIYVDEPPLQKRLAFWYKEYAKYYEYEKSIKKY